MNSDLAKLRIKLKEYIEIILDNYKNYIDNSIVNYLHSNNDIVKLNAQDTVSFICRDGILYLTKKAYNIFPILKNDKHYGSNLNNKVLEENYLDTNTTYFDYINHVIEAGLNEYDYFEESLLHEAMHLYGSGGSSPLKEGINELKTRELAKKTTLK